MNRTTWLQDRRMLSRWERRKLSAMEAGELLGCSQRQCRRYRARYQEEDAQRRDRGFASARDGLVEARHDAAPPDSGGENPA